MKTIRSLPVAFLMLIFVGFSFPSKELTEYGKWLKFHGLNHAGFKKTTAEFEKKIEWKAYELTPEYQELYEPFRIYSKTSNFFIDLDSYSLVLEKEDGKLVSYGSGVDMKAQVIRTATNQAATLLFCGTSCKFETANWLTGHQVETLGFSLIEDRFVPTKWRFDLENMMCSVYQNDQVFDKPPKHYAEEKRLSSIEFD